MKNERDILKSLLLKEELDLLDNLKNKILSEKQFTKEVAHVLSAAIKRAQDTDKKLERALAQPIKEGVKRAFVDSKKSIIDSLLPIMGQLIRKTVTNSIKQFVSDINRTLEQAFSIQYIKWRWQSYKTGIPIAQIVFQKTIRYQVIEIFLINRDNGLLIQHVGADDMLKDNNAISGMLTAIQDFVGDSLNDTDSQLESIEIKGKEILFAFGPKAYLSAVVLGSPTERLKEKMQQLIEHIHADFSDDLSNESEYDNMPDLNDILRKSLVTKSLSPQTKKINWWPWIIIISLSLAYMIFSIYQKNTQYHSLLEKAQSIKGFMLQDIKKINTGYKVSGLLDPLADISALNQDNITLSTQAFISIDPLIIRKRVNKIMADYPSVSFKITDNKLILEGLISPLKHSQLLKKSEKVIGIDEIIDQIKINPEIEIQNFLNSYSEFSQQSEYLPQKQTLRLIGTSSQKRLNVFKNTFNQRFSDVLLDGSLVNIQKTNTELFQIINNTKINLNNILELNTEMIPLNTIDEMLHLIISRESTIQLTITGESDCYGSNSNDFSLLRAQAMKQALINKNIKDKYLSVAIKKCEHYRNNPDNSLLNVSFKIKERK